MNNINLITKIVQPSTTQIGIIKDQFFRPIGSGIFVEFKKSLYLITAGHVLTLSNYADLCIPMIKTAEALFLVHFGDFITTQKEENDVTPADYAFIRFTEKRLEDKVKENYTFIEEEKILFNHQLLKDKFNYFTFGYPSSRRKFNYKTRKSIDITPLRFTTSPFENLRKLIKIGYSMELHGALNIKKTIKKDNQTLILPNTKGMSGSGVYFIPHLNCAHMSKEYYLIGIFVEADFVLNFLLFTKIDYIFSKLY